MAWDILEPKATTDFSVVPLKLRDNNAALEAVLGAARLAAGTEIPEIFPLYNQTPMLFYMAAAPTGWTETSDIGDTLVAVKGGTTYTTSEASKGSWSLPDHTLTTAEMPAHTHTYTSPGVPIANRRTGGSLIVVSVTGGMATSSVGGGKEHSHGSTFRPAARTCIMASKD